MIDTYDDYEIIDRRIDSSKPRQIDFERMESEYLKARERVEEAVKLGDPVAVADAVIAAVTLWDDVGAWPDNWSYAQRALDEVLPSGRKVLLDDVAYSRVEIQRRTK